jgi:hypothetical protein
MLGCLHEWQDLWAGVLAFAAGLLGFMAAIVAVLMLLDNAVSKKCHRPIKTLNGISQAVLSFSSQRSTVAEVIA